MLVAAALAVVTNTAVRSFPAVAAVSGCTSTTGTLIAVDFERWGGPLLRACYTGSPVNGVGLLDAEGFRVTPVQSAGAICRIGHPDYEAGTPQPTDQSCQHMPPASAYWSYWLADPGATTWTYSDHGAYSDNAGDMSKSGQVQLWIFGSTNIGGTSGKPCFTPDEARNGSGGSPCPSSSATSSARASATAPRSPSTKSSAHQTAKSTAAPVRTTSRVTSASTSVGMSAAPTPTVAANRTASASTAGSTTGGAGPTPSAPDTTSSSGVPPIVDAGASPVASTHTSSGSPWPLIAGLIVALALGGAAGWTTWQRRRAR